MVGQGEPVVELVGAQFAAPGHARRLRRAAYAPQVHVRWCVVTSALLGVDRHVSQGFDRPAPVAGGGFQFLFGHDDLPVCAVGQALVGGTRRLGHAGKDRAAGDGVHDGVRVVRDADGEVAESRIAAESTCVGGQSPVRLLLIVDHALAPSLAGALHTFGQFAFGADVLGE